MALSSFYQIEKPSLINTYKNIPLSKHIQMKQHRFNSWALKAKIVLRESKGTGAVKNKRYAEQSSITSSRSDKILNARVTSSQQRATNNEETDKSDGQRYDARAKRTTRNAATEFAVCGRRV